MTPMSNLSIAVLVVSAYDQATSAASSGLGRVFESPFARVSYGVGIILGVLKLFTEVEDRLSDRVKQPMAQWLVRPQIKSFQSWPSTFIDMFDMVFTAKHFSLRCFLRSCFASYAAVAVTGLLWLVFKEPLGEIFHRARVGKAGGPLMFVSFALFANVFPDYLSLLKTRKLLSLMRDSSTLKRVLLVALDFAFAYLIASVTTVISFTFMYALYAPLGPGMNRWSVEFVFHHMTEFCWQALSYYVFRLRVPKLGVFSVMWFIPAFFASIWVWLYVGAGLLVRAVYRLDSIRVLLSRTLKVEEKPLQCIGLVAGLSLALIYWALLIITKAV